MIDIAPAARAPRGALPKRDLTRFVQTACAAIGLLGEVSILLTTSAAMQELNRSFRRKNQPTDVLSFPAFNLPGEPPLAGDLAISLDIAAHQALELGHPLATEVKILLLHGLLHLAGFDHEQDSGQMARRERALRRTLDLPVGLIQRTAAASPRTAKPVAPKPGPNAQAPAKKSAPKPSPRKPAAPKTAMKVPARKTPGKTPGKTPVKIPRKAPRKAAGKATAR
jgi:probable rRNA maturation factor